MHHRHLVLVTLLLGTGLLAGCGQKGPLVPPRPAAPASAASATTPAPAASVPAPAASSLPPAAAGSR